MQIALRYRAADCTSHRPGFYEISCLSYEHDTYNSSGWVFRRRRLHGRASEETSQAMRCVNVLALFRKVFRALRKRARLCIKPNFCSAIANSAAAERIGPTCNCTSIDKYIVVINPKWILFLQIISGLIRTFFLQVPFPLFHDRKDANSQFSNGFGVCKRQKIQPLIFVKKYKVHFF